MEAVPHGGFSRTHELVGHLEDKLAVSTRGNESLHPPAYEAAVTRKKVFKTCQERDHDARLGDLGENVGCQCCQIALT